MRIKEFVKDTKMYTLARCYYYYYLDCHSICKSIKMTHKKAYSMRYHLPTIAGIEPISFCTFNCEFCIIRDLETEKYRSKRRMTAREFEQVAKNIKKFTTNVEFSCGEPLMNEEVFEMFKICRKYHMESLLASNSSLLAYKENWKKILDSPPDRIYFSFEMDDPEDYAKTRHNANYDKIIEGLKLFFLEKQRRKMKKPEVTLVTVVTKRNYMNIDKHIKFCKKTFYNEVDYIYFKQLGVWPEGSAEYVKYIETELLPDFSKCKIMRYYMKDGKIDWDKLGSDCPGYEKHMLIGSGGEIYPCYYIVTKHPSFGNAITDDFISCWIKPENQEYLERMKSGDVLPDCKRCLGRRRPDAESLTVPLKEIEA